MIRVTIRTPDSADIEEFIPERDEWLKQRMGDKLWVHEAGDDGQSHFEDHYDIDDRQVAVLFKLTFGGQQ
jgi:hypothetical protein